ncbi:MAG: hypothetical protein CNLJKLNK_01394 [Holosporales bacterium]
MNMKKQLPLTLFLASCTEIPHHVQESVLGPIHLYHDALKEVNDAPIMQRLKHIDQAGTPFYYCGLPSFSRLDHSLGALYLVQHYGGDLNEQIAALTHDASHTAFSHIADTLFNCEGYQDEIHEYSLDSMNFGEILKKYNICIEDVNPENKGFLRQEQPLPDLCADRIEYNLHTGFVFKLINQQDIAFILKHLFYRNGKWFFDTIDAAKKFSNLSLYFTEKVWGSKTNVYVYLLTAKMLKRALAIKAFDMKTFHFGTDLDLLKIIDASNDPEIVFYREKIKSIDMRGDLTQLKENSSSFSVEEKKVSPKFRGVDPLVLTKDGFKRLTTLDPDYKKDYDRVKKLMHDGFTLKIPLFY